MSEFITQSLQLAASYVILVGALLFAMNWLTKNFLWNYFRVRASRGSKILIPIHSVDDVYFATGSWNSTTLKFKDRTKSECSLVNPPRHSIYMMAGVKALDYDEVNKCVWTRSGAVIQGNDPLLVDAMMDRILKNPLEQSTMVKICIAALALLFIFAMADIYLSYTTMTLLKQVLANGAAKAVSGGVTVVG